MKEKDLNNKPADEKTQLTPAQIQKRKKMLILPLFFLIFAGAMWLIFAPSGSKDQEQNDGLNSDVPMPKDGGIYGDKKTAYEQEAMRQKQQEKMKSLNDYAFMMGETDTESEDYKRQVKLAPVPPDYQEELNRQADARNNRNTRSNAFQSSANHYEDINRQLGSFYTDTSAEDEQEKLETEYRIQELERRLEEQNEAKRIADEQFELMEKSYQMAARYMPGAPQGADDPATAQPTVTTAKKPVTAPVSGVRKNVVSLLAAPMSDEQFMEEYTKPRNWGFNTVAGNEQITDKNTISACIYKTVTITNGQEVQLRLLEPLRAGDHIVPANTLITGMGKINGERLDIAITHIQHAENIIPVEIQVFDMDGNKGISVPGSEEIKAAQEIAANMGSQLGSSITITDDAGSQLAADMGRSVIQGTSQYISKKMRTVRVTLKAGHKVLLLPPTK